MEALLTVGASATVLAPIAWPHYHVWVVLAGLWLVSFPVRRHQLLGLVVCIFLSLPWVIWVISGAADGNLLVLGDVNLEVLIPVLIGLFGLPHRPVTATAKPGPTATLSRSRHEGCLTSAKGRCRAFIWESGRCR